MSDTLVPDEPQSATPDGPSAGPVHRRRVAPFVALAVAVALGALLVVLAGSKTGGNEAVSSFPVLLV